MVQHLVEQHGTIFNQLCEPGSPMVDALFTSLAEGDDDAFCLLGHALNLTQNRPDLRETLFRPLVNQERSLFSALLGFLDGVKQSELEPDVGEDGASNTRSMAYACAMDLLNAACHHNVMQLKVELIKAETGENGKMEGGNFTTLINVLLGELHVPH